MGHLQLPLRGESSWGRLSFAVLQLLMYCTTFVILGLWGIDHGLRACLIFSWNHSALCQQDLGFWPCCRMSSPGCCQKPQGDAQAAQEQKGKQNGETTDTFNTFNTTPTDTSCTPSHVPTTPLRCRVCLADSSPWWQPQCWVNQGTAKSRITTQRVAWGIQLMESGSGATQRQCPYFAKERALYKIMLSSMPQALSHFQCFAQKNSKQRLNLNEFVVSSMHSSTVFCSSGLVLRLDPSIWLPHHHHQYWPNRRWLDRTSSLVGWRWMWTNSAKHFSSFLIRLNWSAIFELFLEPPADLAWAPVARLAGTIALLAQHLLPANKSFVVTSSPFSQHWQHLPCLAPIVSTWNDPSILSTVEAAIGTRHTLKFYTPYTQPSDPDCINLPTQNNQQATQPQKYCSYYNGEGEPK